MCISLTGWSLLKGHMIEIRMVSVDENSLIKTFLLLQHLDFRDV